MPDAGSPDVTVLIPAKNEEQTIEEVVNRVLALGDHVQVIVIDDGSSDTTNRILEGFGDRIVLLHNPRSLGKGASIRAGLPYAKGKVVVIQDADLEYAPEQIPSLTDPILKGQYSVVYGTRFGHGFPKGMALPNKLVNKLLVWAVKLLYGHTVTDEATCYKAVRRDLLHDMDLECQRFEFCPEITAKTIRLGEHIHEVPIEYVPRSKEAGKKIRWTDAPEAFWTLWKYRHWRP